MSLNERVPALSDLESLAAVANHGSMTAAASELGMTQQAISLKIRSIERLLGQPVVLRSRRGCELTGAGRLLNEWASSLLSDARQLAVGIESIQANRRGHLKVAASLTVAEHLLPSWLVTLHETQARTSTPPTDVQLSALNTEAVVGLVQSGEADLGLIEGPQKPKGLHARAVAEDELLIVVRPDHPWTRSHRPISVARLARTPMIGREAGSGSRQAFDAALTAALPRDFVRADPALEVSTPAAVRAALAAGVGPAAISSLAVADDLALGRLKVIEVEGLDLRRILRAVWLGELRPADGPVRQLLSIATTSGTAARGRPLNAGGSRT